MSIDFENRNRRRLLTAGPELPDDVARRILDRGPASVPMLLEVLELAFAVQQDTEAWGPNHAALLLGEMAAAEAVPILVRMLDELADEEPLHDAGTVLLVDATEALIRIGEPAVQPLLDLYHRTASQETRAWVGEALGGAGEGDPRVRPVLMHLLEIVPEAAAAGMALYGDKTVVPDLLRVLAGLDLKTDEKGFSAGAQTFLQVAEAVAELEGELPPEQQARLAEAESLATQPLADEGAPGDEDWDEPSADLGDGGEEEEPPLVGVAMDEAAIRLRTLGRNDPCFCASGKKYKKCHMPADEASARAATTREPA